MTIYVMSVGQGDTSIFITPSGKVIIIDAVRPGKLVHLLHGIGLDRTDRISELIITHPHTDHFSGASRLLREFNVENVTLCPFWNLNGLGSPSYRTMVNTMEVMGIPIDFVSGYSRIYPDGAMTASIPASLGFNPNSTCLELIGPPNSLISSLERAGKLDTNHLSVMARLTWNQFSMIFAADAQMENWAYFDQEGMLDKRCSVLKSAHHGSGNGTQWERLRRLDPRCVIVSSDPDRRDHLPDLIGTAIFTKFEVKNQSKLIALTKDTGSIRIVVSPNRREKISCFGDDVDGRIDLSRPMSLTWNSNPTDWRGILQYSMRRLYVEA